MEIPAIWLWVSGAFFLFGTLSYMVMVVLLLRLIGVVNELKPKVERITERVEAISGKVDALATTAKDTVESVGGGAKNITKSVEGLVVGTSGKMQQITSILGIVMTGYQLFQQFQSVKASKQPKQAEEEE